MLSLFLNDDILDFISGPVLFLKDNELLLQGLYQFFRQVFKRVLKQDFGPFELVHPDFKLGKCNEKAFIEGSFAKFY